MANGESFMEFDVRLESYNIIAKKVSERWRSNRKVQNDGKFTKGLKLESGRLRVHLRQLAFLLEEPRRSQGVAVMSLWGFHLYSHFSLLFLGSFSALWRTKEYSKSFSSFSAASEQRQCTRWSLWSNHLSWCGTPPQVLPDDDNDGGDFHGGDDKSIWYVWYQVTPSRAGGSTGEMTTEFTEEDDLEWHLSLARLNMKNATLVWFLDPFLLDRTSNSKYVPSNVFTKRRHSFFDKTVSMSSSDIDIWPLHCYSHSFIKMCYWKEILTMLCPFVDQYWES